MTPLVTIAMTARNADRWLEDAIKSVLLSSMPDFELLFYLDGAGELDRSAQIMADWCYRDKRCRMIGFRHIGRAAALKTALEAGVGRYLCWVDADDILMPKALETCLARMRSDESEICFTGMSRIAPGGHEIERVMPAPPRPGLPSVCTHFCLIDSSLYNFTGGVDIKYECAMDLDLQLRCALAASKTSVVREALYCYRQHSESISRRQRYKQRECARLAIESALKQIGQVNE